jgi:flagellar biosynthetic protein FliO
MQRSTEIMLARLKWWQNLPRWAQVTVLVLAGGLFILGLALNQASPAGSPAPETTSMTGLWLDAAGKLVVILALIGGAALVLKHWQRSPWRTAERKIAVVETVHLAPRRAIHLVRVGGQHLLVGATDQAITLLSEIEIEPQAEGVPASFHQALNAASQAGCPADCPADSPLQGQALG